MRPRAPQQGGEVAAGWQRVGVVGPEHPQPVVEQPRELLDRGVYLPELTERVRDSVAPLQVQVVLGVGDGCPERDDGALAFDVVGLLRLPQAAGRLPRRPVRSMR